MPRARTSSPALQSPIASLLTLAIFALFALGSTFLWMRFMEHDRTMNGATHAAAGACQESMQVMDRYLAERDERIEELTQDATRLEDAANVLLALQEYHAARRSYPPTLAALVEEGLLDAGQIVDPVTLVTYRYLRKQTDFVFCVRLSDAWKGVNTDACEAL